MRYLALLRGINVGGKNIIKMADLKACFENMGGSDVRTYIQSGNVIFSTKEKNTDKLTSTIEKRLTKTFSYTSRIVLLTEKQLVETVHEVPAGFGTKPEKYRYDILFVKPPRTPPEIIEGLEAKEGVDEIFQGKYAVYFVRLISKATQSRLSKFVASPLYRDVTIRNWNTTSKLYGLLRE